MPAIISCTTVIAIILFIIGFLFLYFLFSSRIKQDASGKIKRRNNDDETLSIFKNLDKKAEEGKFEDIKKDK
ncbi:hypothetical protein JXL83_02265 [candidate division WOR-3 bacterium]|nr:hypothetical protein [candidate division WOR-3 bacterium]